MERTLAMLSTKRCYLDKFKDEGLLLKSAYPRFTDCFIHTVLVWGPCGLLWALVCPYSLIIWTYRSPVPIAFGKLNVAKTLLSLLLAGLGIGLLAHHVTNSGNNFPAVYISDGLKIATYLLCAAIIQQERMCGFINSFLLFPFWLITTVLSVIPFYTNIEEKVFDSDAAEFYLYTAYFLIVILEFLLFCIADSKPGHRRYNKANTNQAANASIASHLSFGWLNKLVFRAFRQKLKEDDYDMPSPTDISQYLVARFEKAWQKEKERCDEINKKRSLTEQSSKPHLKPFFSKWDTQYPEEENEKSRLLEPEVKSKPEVPKGKGSLLESFQKDDISKRDKDNLHKFPSLLRVISSNHGKMLFIFQTLGAAMELLKFASPKITEALLAFISDRDSNGPAWRAYVLACSYFVINSISSFFLNVITYQNRRIGFQIRSAVTAAIYKKSLTINNEAKRESTAGEIVNLMSVDSQRLANAMEFINVIVSAPCQIAVGIYMLFDQLGIAVFAGLAVFILMFPCSSVVSVLLRRYNRLQMLIKDKRIRYMTEILNGMKVLKLYAWEAAFSSIVQKIRAVEMTIIFKQSFVMATLTLIFRVMPYFVQLTSFGVFIAVDDYLDPSKAFVSISLFNNLTQALVRLPFIIPIIAQALVALHRVEAFLNQPDRAPDVISMDPTAEDPICIENGTFTWNSNAPLPTLRNINARVRPGSLVAVVGTVGAGKTSLLSAMLGEMTKLKGKVTLKSNVAYVPQEAWIQNATLRDNILFGSGYKSSFYETVVDACGLKTDLEILSAGDETEIGEKGINISGGQKQRVSLARAVYKQADIFMLDDPLSAVDSHVGKHIFNKVIGRKGLLRDKTRILVTHGIHWLPLVDTIWVISNGTITEKGTYEDLLSHGGDFAQVIRENLIQEEAEAEAQGYETDSKELDPELQEMKNKVLEKLEVLESMSTDAEKQSFIRSLSYRRSSSTQTRPQSASFSASQEKRSTAPKAGQKLIEDEGVERGSVDKKVYLDYINAIGISGIIISTSLFVLYAVSSAYSRIWLSDWTDDPYLANISLKDTQEYSDRNTKYLAVYGVLGAGQGIFLYMFSTLLLLRTAIASRTMHNNMLDNIMKAPMSYFDTTPIGRIVNRFSRDVESLDNSMPNICSNTITRFGMVLIAFGSMTYSTPLIVSVVIPILFIYVIVQRVYMPFSRQTKRFESITRSPIYIHFSETISGCASIRAYQAQDRNIELSKQRVDNNFKFNMAQVAAQSWLQIRLEFLGNFIVMAAAIFAILDESLSASLAGVSVTYAQEVTNSMRFLIQNLTRLETEIVAVERIVEYTNVVTEKAWHNPLTKPSPIWPIEGNIKLQDLQIRYRPGLDLVLRGINCDIKGGQKIGIVGRTGAGKSSLTVALFRLVEAAGGQIIIDNKIIGELGLHDLRSKITILPQDPVIFSGNIRTNLDPCHEHGDADIWQALAHAHLCDFVRSLPSQLDYECGENGQNLSVGQRQLLCLARTLLRKTKILVLDEATAAVDVETDKLIQNTIRTDFKDSTVLSIAHRLNTILDYDKVIVMDAGNIKELDSPSNLLADTSSAFYSMAKDAKIVQ